MFKEAEYPNPHFNPNRLKLVLDTNGNEYLVESFCRKFLHYIQTSLVLLIFIVTYIVGITFFVQWYTAAMLAPVCSECPSCSGFLSCFKTRRAVVFSYRWFYIFVQGILLGILLDIFVYLVSAKLLRFFVIRENHRTEAQVECTVVNRLFVINWISFFLWFLLIAFVIIPFGKQVEDWISLNITVNKLTVDWEKGHIDMSTALVTPLLITQGLNLLIDAALPYLRSKKGQTSKPIPTSPMSKTTKYNDSSIMLPPQIPIIAKQLNMHIPILRTIENGGPLRADEILEEAALPLYNPFVSTVPPSIYILYEPMYNRQII